METKKSIERNDIIPFPHLPTELIRCVFNALSFCIISSCIFREIVELAASCRTTSLALTLVSSFVRLWSLPSIYNAVVLRNSGDVKSFLHSISSSLTDSILIPNVPLAHHVKHLAIFALGPLQSIEGVIMHCPNVSSLACGFSLSSYSAINLKLPTAATITEIPSETHIRERHLLGLSCRDGIPFALLSQDITHLHVQITSLQVLLSLLQTHKQLPVLTHLALRIPSTLLATPHSASLFFKSLQEYNKNLCTILVLVTDRSEMAYNEWDVVTGVLDAKVVIQRASGSAVSHWDDTSTWGEGNLWASANLEVEKRRKAVEELCSVVA